MIYDAITFNGEHDLLEIRLNILDSVVDQFIIVEFPETFSGNAKELTFEKQKNRYKQWEHKIKYFVPRDYMEKYYELAITSPNTQYGLGADHWVREFCQKESIKDTLIGLKDDDIVFVGDVDEVWKPELAKWQWPRPIKARYLVYSYWLNNLSTEVFWGTLISRYANIKNECLNHLRSSKSLYWAREYLGWHFTSLKDSVRQKLLDSYTKETYANDWVMSHLDENVAQNKDFLGRNFTYSIDEVEWPQYLKDNREKYKHLLR